MNRVAQRILTRCSASSLILACCALGLSQASSHARPIEPEPAGAGLQSSSRVGYYAAGPMGRDFQVGERVAFRAQAPDPAALAETRRQRTRFTALNQAGGIPENVQASYEGQTQGASRPVTDFSEVHIAVSPINPDHLLGSSKFFHTPASYGFYTGVFESFDGGLTWEQEQPAGLEAYSLTSDPVNTFDHEGAGYFTLLTRGPTGLDMMKKPAGGAWSNSIVDRSTNTDKQWIVADFDPQGESPYAGHLYMSWTDVGAGRIVFKRSTDGNATWTPDPVLELGGGNPQGSVPAVAPDGTVYVLWGDTIFGSAQTGTLRFVKSTDGGATFSSDRVAAGTISVPFQLPGSVFRTPASLPGFTVSPMTGNLFAVWADYRNGDADIYLTRSTNGGEDWDDPLRLNDDPLGNGIDQFQPQVSVSPNGRVAVAWLDRRLTCPDLPFIPADNRGLENFCIDTFMARSMDEGESWEPNMRISAQSWDWSLNLPMVNQTTGFIGDYIGMASTTDMDYAFFPSTADLGDNPENRQQAFVARVPAVPPPMDFSGSSLSLSARGVQPSEALTLTMRLHNRGPEDALSTAITLSLPADATYVLGSLQSELSGASYDEASHSITWQGGLAADSSASLSLQIGANEDTEEGDGLESILVIQDDTGRRYQRRARAEVSLPPTIVRTTPPDGEVDVGVSTIVLVSFSEAMDTESLVVNASATLPDGSNQAVPQAFWQTFWSPNRRALSLRHPREEFADASRYRIEISATDESGLPLVPGDVPNPWTFSTEGFVQEDARAYLPWLGRGVERAAE